MSPTIYHDDRGGLRFFFFSNEEERMHVHVKNNDGKNAKIWLEPVVALAQNHGLTPKQLKQALSSVKEHEDEIRNEWQAYFGAR